MGEAILALVLWFGAHATVLPVFTGYPADPVYAGPHRLVLGKGDVAYRTRLRRGAEDPVNYAGHYVLAVWGCGADCVMGAAIDVRSGRVHWLPGTVCCGFTDGPGHPDIEPVRFQRDSRLLVLTGLRDEREGDGGEHYYVIGPTGFVHVRDASYPAATRAP